MRYLRSSEICNELKISPATLKSWKDKGKITFKKLSDRKYLYDIDSILNQDKNKDVAIYGRVSITSQKEDLAIKSSDKGFGKTFNRLCNNQWNRTATVNNLKVLSSTYGIELVEVNAVYSSFIGNLENGDNTTPDMVASSIEIARRGYKKFFKNWFYPRFDLEKVKNKFNQWKEEIYSDVKDWKDLFQKIKKSGMRYRFQLNDCDAVFKRFYHKTNVITYFYI